MKLDFVGDYPCSVEVDEEEGGFFLIISNTRNTFNITESQLIL